MTKLRTLWVIGITFGVAYACVRPGQRPARATPTIARFSEIEVERIKVVEPDGKPRVIISNAARYPGAFFDGTEYPHPNRTPTGGVLFYNGDGTEAGGIGYTSERRADGTYEAGAIITIDQYNQNESIKLTYNEIDGKRGGGLVVYDDHPNASLKTVLAASQELERAKTAVERRAAQARLDELVQTHVGESRPRVFVGRELDDAMLVLSDKHGVPRIVLRVGADGEPHVETRDGAGNVVKKL